MDSAITPSPPFWEYSFLRIDAVILPLFLTSFLFSSHAVYKAAGFAIGFVIFGDPLMTPGLQWLNHKYPKWLETLEPKKYVVLFEWLEIVLIQDSNILRGIPTNNQLTLTLLRIGEVRNTPLPPVPTSNPNDADQRKDLGLGDIPVEATDAEKLSAIHESPTDGSQHEAGEQKPEPKHTRLSKVTRFFKGNTKSAIESKLAFDQVRAAAGSEKAKNHLGVLPKPKNLIYAGPSHYKARFDGKQGWLYITESPKPVLLYTTVDPRPESTQVEDLDAVLSLDIHNIRELKRATAFVSKPAEMATNWSSDKALLGSVEIVDENGKQWRFTALPERDELFNRLIAIGAQRWENL